MEDAELKIGGFTLKGWYIAAAIPILGAVSSTIYFGYDTLNRFLDVEESVTSVLEVESRVQTIEQAIQDNDVRGLTGKLANLSTQMQAILEQQKQLLDLRSKIEKSETITSNLDGTLTKHRDEIEDLWKALDDLAKNPLK
jgi:predicted RNase H-like nuclease (RuvC/YqgF family)